MKVKGILTLVGVVGLLSSCGCSDTPQVDYLSKVRSMMNNIATYEGPLTINLLESGNEGSTDFNYAYDSSCDKETSRFYKVSESSHSKTVFVPEIENSKIGMEYCKGNYSYKKRSVYSRLAHKHSYDTEYGGFLSYLVLADSPSLLKEYEEYNSSMYIMMMAGTQDVEMDPLSFRYGFSTTSGKYKFTCIVSRAGYAAPKGEHPSVTYESNVSIEFDEEYLYLIDSKMSLKTFTGEVESFSYNYNQLFTYSLSFDETKYNTYKAELLAEDLPSQSESKNVVNFIVQGCMLTNQYISIGSNVDFASIKSYVEEHYQVDVLGFYLDEELTQEVTSLVSDEYQKDLYIKVSVKDGYYVFITDTTSEVVALPGDLMSPELYNKLYYQENLYRYIGFHTYAFNEQIELPLRNVENKYKIMSVTLDGSPYDTYTASFASGNYHTYNHITRKYSSNDGSSFKSAVPVLEVNSINTSDGIYLRNFDNSASCWYKINVKDIKKSNFQLEYKDYQINHLLTSNNISQLQELDKSDLSITFKDENENTITSIPEGYEGDLYFQVSYDGSAKLHYVLIG